MEQCATHLPLLISIICSTKGNILELGTGFYSTYILNEISRKTKRHILSVENNQEWFKVVSILEHPYHKFKYCDSFDQVDIDQKDWEVVFIDHAPVERRIVDIKRLFKNSKYFIIHDSEAPQYLYEEIYPLFKYRYDYTLLRPYTTLLSNEEFDICL